tara:strand:- start:67 stop:975 length:909 start_codon:yes stop_codon:yes gene_type:complete
MYHYVRPIKNSECPNLKGLELNGFLKQLDYLQENFSIITTEEAISAVKYNNKLPENACWLTFDDGYKDHYKYVMPELLSRNISGAFFPSGMATKGSEILGTNSIQYILANCKNIEDLKLDLNELCLSNGVLESELDKYFLKYGVANRFDNETIIYIKRMLQHVLPQNIRNNIITSLFDKYVGISQNEFSKKLYMNIEDLKDLKKNGMFIGNHTSTHRWLNKLSDEEQMQEIKSSLEFLEEVGVRLIDWIMCYPYGGYNKKTISITKKLGAAIGVTIEARTACIGKDNPLKLPRLDTNDFPQK